MNVLLLLLLIVGYETKIVRTSIYHPVQSQCDSTPKITSCGIHISDTRLKGGTIRYVSLSRDLLKEHKYGSYIIVKCANAYYNGKWLVVDTMNKRFKNKIDFLQHEQNKHIPPKKVEIQWLNKDK
jgi:hypothetical protein